MNKFKFEKHKEAFEYALHTIKNSTIYPYIKKVVLYGSCARNEEKWDSDVDLLIVTENTVEQNDDLRLAARYLQGNCSPAGVDDAEVDMHIINIETWLNKNTTYLNEIRRDGINICL